MKPDSNPKAPEAAKSPGKVRNLTHEGIRAHLEQNKQAAMLATPPFEVTKVHLPKKDAKGAVVKDADGFVELIEKVVLKRDLVAAEWDEKIAGYGG